MASIVDERGYNQMFKPTATTAFRLRRRVEAMVREMRLPDSAEERRCVHILEIGCGLGEQAYVLAQITGARVTGVDLSVKFIEHASATYRCQGLDFIVADLSRCDSGEERYDYIVGNGILHHLYNQLDSFLPALARWLKPAGRLIFWEPNLVNPYVWLIFSIPFFRRMAKLEPDEMAFTSGFIHRKLTAAGLVRSRIFTRDFLLPNTPAFLVRTIVCVGGWLERIPVVNRMAQSIFFVAGR